MGFPNTTAVLYEQQLKNDLISSAAAWERLSAVYLSHVTHEMQH